TRLLRYVVSVRLFKNDREGPIHRHFMNKLGTIDRATLDFIREKNVREICVNWFDNVDCALNIRKKINAPNARIVVHTHDVMAHHKHIRRGRRLDISRLEINNLAKADELVHVSDADAAYFAKRISKPQKTSYITLHPETEGRLRALRRTPRPRTVLY